PGNVKPASFPFENEEEREGGGWGHLHSLYVNFAAERGALGLLAYFGMIAALFSELVQGARRFLGKDQIILWGAVGGLLGFLVSGITETIYNTSIISMTFYFVMGIGLAVARRDRSE